MILRIDSFADFACFPSKVAGCRRPARGIGFRQLVTRGQSSPNHGLCSSLVARCGGRVLPEVSVHTEFFLVRIIISLALLQKFRKIDGFEQTPRRHIV